MALDEYILTFETITGHKFTNRPNIRRISKFISAKMKNKQETEWKKRWCQAEKKRESFFLAFARVLGFFSMLSVDHPPFFDYKTNTLYLPFDGELNNQQNIIIYSQLARALLYDRDKKFGFDINPLVVDWLHIANHVFGDGFANFCTYEILVHEGKAKEGGYATLCSSDDIHKAYDGLFKVVSDNQNYYRAFIDPSFDFPGGKPPLDPIEIEKWKTLSSVERLQKLTDNYTEILMFSPIWGYKCVDEILEKYIGRANADHATLVKCLLNRVPNDFRHLFSPCALYYKEP